MQWILQGRGQRRASNGQERLSQNKARSSTASLGLAKARPSATEAVSGGDKACCPRLGPRPAPATQGSMPQVHCRRTWVVKTRLWTVILGKTEEREPGKRRGEGRGDQGGEEGKKREREKEWLPGEVGLSTLFPPIPRTSFISFSQIRQWEGRAAGSQAREKRLSPRGPSAPFCGWAPRPPAHCRPRVTRKGRRSLSEPRPARGCPFDFVRRTDYSRSRIQGGGPAPVATTPRPSPEDAAGWDAGVTSTSAHRSAPPTPG